MLYKKVSNADSVFFGRTHGALYRGYGYVPLRFVGSVVRRMGTQQNDSVFILKFEQRQIQNSKILETEITALPLRCKPWQSSYNVRPLFHTESLQSCHLVYFFILFYEIRNSHFVYILKTAVYSQPSFHRL